jgi:hypothetical protein
MKVFLILFFLTPFSLFAADEPQRRWTLTEVLHRDKYKDKDKESGVFVYKIKHDGKIGYYVYPRRPNFVFYSDLVSRGMFFETADELNQALKNTKIGMRNPPLAGKPPNTKVIEQCHYGVCDLATLRFAIADEATQKRACKEHSIDACILTGEFPEKTCEYRLSLVKATIHLHLIIFFSRNDLIAYQRFWEKPLDQDILPEAQLCMIKSEVAAKTLTHVINRLQQSEAPDFWDFFDSEYAPKDFTARFLALSSKSELGLLWQRRSLAFLSPLWMLEANTSRREKILKTLVERTRDSRQLFPVTALFELRNLIGHCVTEKEFSDLCLKTIHSKRVNWLDKLMIKKIILNKDKPQGLHYLDKFLSHKTFTVTTAPSKQ